MLLVPTAYGDALDRLTILAIKLERVVDDAARAHVAREHEALLRAWRAVLPEPAEVPEHAQLRAVNEALWAVEDRLRAREAARDFGPAFVEDARSVYTLNDRRAALKRAVNERLGSLLVEVKQHPAYRG